MNNESQTALDQASGTTGQAVLSPKATAVVSPTDRWDLFANYGRGFHTNDARTLLPVQIEAEGPTTTVKAVGQSPTLIATATGYEVGTTVRPSMASSLSAVAFLIDLTSGAHDRR